MGVKLLPLAPKIDQFGDYGKKSVVFHGEIEGDIDFEWTVGRDVQQGDRECRPGLQLV